MPRVRSHRQTGKARSPPGVAGGAALDPPLEAAEEEEDVGEAAGRGGARGSALQEASWRATLQSKHAQ